MKRFAVVSLSALLAACGGGGGGSSAPATNSVTVAPSLGKFSNGAKVSIAKPDGTKLGSGTISNGLGTITIDVGTYSGPILIQVAGDTGVQYYDEGSRQLVDFGASDKLEAIAASVKTQVGVTAATNAAVAAIRANNNNAVPSTISTTEIETRNAKIAQALGIDDVLQAPKLVDSNTTGLSLAKAEDKYALKLAALAKLASSGNTALNVAQDLARDLSDDVFDGKQSDGNGGQVTISTMAFNPTSIVADLQAKVVSATTEIGDDDAKIIVSSDPTVLGTVTTDVSTVSVSSKTNVTDLQLAKAMFSELRTTLNSYANSFKTGFLDTQAQRATTDLSANISPEMSKVANRVSSVLVAMGMFDNNGALSTGVNPLTSATGKVLESGSLNAAIYGWGGYLYCATDLATGVNSKVTCAITAPPNNLIFSAGATVPTVKMVVLEVTKSGAGFTYTAKPYTMVPSYNPTTWSHSPNWTTLAAANTSIPSGSGTVSTTVSGTTVTGLTLNGTFPPSNAGTGVDTVAISASRTSQGGSIYRYNLSGSVAADNASDATKSVTLSLDSGSYADVDESTIKPVAASLQGTFKTAATKFTGTLTGMNYVSSADKIDFIPSKAVFTGSISDTSTGGAGEFLTGKLEISIADYDKFYKLQPETSTNFQKTSFTFTGTIQAPSRPLMKLVLTGNTTGLNTGTVTLNYSYGTVSLIGSGTATNGLAQFTLTNQDGVQVSPGTSGQMTVTKSGAQLATLSNGVVNYVDGTSVSFK